MRLWLVGLFCFFLKPAFAQKLPQPWTYGAYAHGGFILNHSPFMRHLAVSHPVGFELNVQKQTTGSKPWHQLYKFPRIGFAFDYFDLRNPVLGKVYAGSTYLNKTLLKTRNGALNYRLGVGLAYLPTGYDQESNHKNTVASSALNASMQTRFEYEHRLAKYFSVLVGLGLNHYSNGATKKPNQGINIPTLSFGLNYHTVSEANVQPQPLPEFAPDWLFTLSTTAGFRQINASNNKNYLVQSLTGTAAKPLNRKSNLVIGAEFFYDRSLKVQQLTDTTLTGKPFPDTKKGGLFLGHELLFGNLAFGTQLGYYVYRPYKTGTFYYERLELKYHFTPHLFGGLGLKVHGFAADVVEARVGYTF